MDHHEKIIFFFETGILPKPLRENYLTQQIWLQHYNC